eukprot:g1348.t1
MSLFVRYTSTGVRVGSSCRSVHIIGNVLGDASAVELTVKYTFDVDVKATCPNVDVRFEVRVPGVLSRVSSLALNAGPQTYVAKGESTVRHDAWNIQSRSASDVNACHPVYSSISATMNDVHSHPRVEVVLKYISTLDCVSKPRRSYLVISKTLCPCECKEFCKVTVALDSAATARKIHLCSEHRASHHVRSPSHTEVVVTCKCLDRDLLFRVNNASSTLDSTPISMCSDRVAELCPSPEMLSDKRSPSEIVVIATSSFRDRFDDRAKLSRAMRGALRVTAPNVEDGFSLLNLCVGDEGRWLCRKSSGHLTNALLERADAYVRQYCAPQSVSACEDEVTTAIAPAIPSATFTGNVPSGKTKDVPGAFAGAIESALRGAQHQGSHHNASRPPLHLLLLFADDDIVEKQRILSHLLRAKLSDQSFRVFLIGVGTYRSKRFVRDVLSVVGSGRGIVLQRSRTGRMYRAWTTSLFASSSPQILPSIDENDDDDDDGDDTRSESDAFGATISSNVQLWDVLLSTMSEISAPYLIGSGMIVSQTRPTSLGHLWSDHCGMLLLEAGAGHTKGSICVEATNTSTSVVTQWSIDSETEEDSAVAKASIDMRASLSTFLRVEELERQKQWPFPPRSVLEIDRSINKIIDNSPILFRSKRPGDVAISSHAHTVVDTSSNARCGLYVFETHVRPDISGILASRSPASKQDSAATKCVTSSSFEITAPAPDIPHSDVARNDVVGGGILSMLFGARTRIGFDGKVAPDVSGASAPVPPPLAAEKAVDAKATKIAVDPFERLVMLQRADGSWRWTNEFSQMLQSAIRVDEASIVALKRKKGKCRQMTWATAVAAHVVAVKLRKANCVGTQLLLGASCEKARMNLVDDESACDPSVEAAIHALREVGFGGAVEEKSL